MSTSIKRSTIGVWVHRRRRLRWAVAAMLLMAVGGWTVRLLWKELGLRADANEARRLVAVGKMVEAEPFLQRWFQARPNSAEACFLVARAMLVSGLPEQGFAALGRARALGHPLAEVERLRGIALSKLGRHREAEPLLRGFFLQVSNPDPELDEALAKTLLETFQIQDAARVIDRWIQEAPTDPKPYLWKAVVDRKSVTENEVLIDDFSKALERDPNSAEARFELAGLYLQMHRLDDAEREYDAYLKLKPNDHAAFVGLGQIAMERGQEDEAIEKFREATKLDPRDLRPLLELGKLELRRGRFESAIATLDQAVAVDSTEPEVHYLRSLVLARMGRIAESKAELEATDRLRSEGEVLKKIQLDLLNSPRDVEAQHKAARWMFENGHPEEGLRWAEKILKENPGHSPTNRLLAQYYEKKGNPGLANYYRVQSGPAAVEGRP